MRISHQLLGSEQGGIRPVLIIQNNKGNLFSPTLIVAPITRNVSSGATNASPHRNSP